VAVSLSKGGNVSLSKEAPGLKSVHVGLGWDARVTDGQSFDLDASVFLLSESGKVRSDADFVFYNNKNGGDGAVVHQGDNTTGAGEGDDEVVTPDTAIVFQPGGYGKRSAGPRARATLVPRPIGRHRVANAGVRLLV